MKSTLWKKIHEWCLRQSTILKANDPQMKIQMSNHKLLKQIPGELENSIKCRYSQSCTLDDISDTLQDVSKRTNIGRYYPYKSSSFKEKKPFRVEIKYKPKEIVAEVAKKKNSFHSCGSTDHYSNSSEKAKKKVYAIEQVQEEESPTEGYESDSMGDAIREHFDYDQDPKEDILVEYQE
ncbi:hypothetical protein O181_023525 [Austropuccinia psidii MF-1]|uniref:Uncharacterized protein n=1 Tax=Austropuccinia psidii MF-1 TaxID=1389203 RepID=A0A9Q3CJ91_9BASI|nr:hypothetical protein [Austropuccinia psidii MF-1]